MAPEIIDSVSPDTGIVDMEDTSFKFGKMLANPPPGEEVVISGISGRFPDSENVEQFRDNLFNKVDLVTGDNRRWEPGHPEIPQRIGKMPSIEKFDAGFFGVHHRQANSMDPMVRMFLEKAVEALFDAGLHPSDIEDTNTGVFVGSAFSENEKTWFFDKLIPATFAITGCTRSMIANRVSYFLKLKGPSMICDTACSSSLYGLEHAYKAIRTGKCDKAIVGGTNLTLHPFVSLQFSRLGVLSMDGTCKVFDNAGNGYVRSEAISVVLLQRAKESKRIYATVVHAKSNCDGYKDSGITFPLGEMQIRLIKEIYNECDSVKPTDLSFLEAHGTGTKVGDPEELQAIEEIFVKGRTDPLLIGSIKSNIGHTEPSSGLASVTKSIIAFETGFIPPNLHYQTPRVGIKSLENGNLKVVTEKTRFMDNRGLIGINSFGFGGGNCHVLLKHNTKTKVNNGQPRDNIPRIVCVSGRTKEAVTVLLEDVCKNNVDAEQIGLLHEIFRKTIPGHHYRGFSLVSKSAEIVRSTNLTTITNPTLVICFGVIDKSIREQASEFLKIPLFVGIIQKIHEVLETKGFDIMTTLLKPNDKNSLETLLANLTLHLVFADVLKSLQIIPDKIFGVNSNLSLGTLACAYYDGALSLKEIIECAYTIAHAMNLDSSCDTESCDILISKSQKIATQLQQNLTKILGKPRRLSKHVIFNSSPSEISSIYLTNSFGNINVLKDVKNVLNKNVIVFEIGNGKISNMLKNEAKNMDDKFVVNGVQGLDKFLISLGGLYNLGFQPQVQNLYPRIKFPVSRGTPMISPKIKWDHTRDWFVTRYNSNENMEIEESTHGVVLRDPCFGFIGGHNIDGRTLFPATGYLVFVWDTLAHVHNRMVSDMKVIFENCKFKRACSVPKEHPKLELTVMVQRVTGNFEVIEGGVTVVTGRITQDAHNDTDLVPLNLPTGISEHIAPPMTSKDIYKELRLRGYNYKGQFRGLQSCDNSAEVGKISWDGDWITFMDSMLQMKILQEDTRLLYVPTCIRKLTIDAKKHIEYAKKMGEKPDLPVYVPRDAGIIRQGHYIPLIICLLPGKNQTVYTTLFNLLTDKCNENNLKFRPKNVVIDFELGIHNDVNQIWRVISGAIEIRGLIANSIARRKYRGIPVLEKYVFVPNEGTLKTEQAVRVNVQLLLENLRSIKVKVVELIDDATSKEAHPLGEMIHDALADLPLIQPDITILSKTELDIKNVKVEDKKLLTEVECSLVVGSKILQRTLILQLAFGCIKPNAFILSREPLDFDTDSCTHQDISIITAFTTEEEKLILFKKSTEYKVQEVVRISSEDHKFSWLTILKNALSKEEKALVISFNDPMNGAMGMVNCLRQEPGGQNVRLLFIPNSSASELDLTLPLYLDQLQKNLAINVYKNNKWGSYRHLLLEEGNTIKVDHCFLNSMVRGDLSSLKWIEGPLKTNTKVDPENTLVTVYYAAINFRDVMIASGKINVDSVTRDRRSQECVQGFEFSGRTQDGRRVMGLKTNGACSSLITTDSYTVWEVPDHWSLKDAATIPVVYFTCLYALLQRGNMKRGETVLIHSGTGGIGQAAITLALHVGCTVYTTVGTDEKREFLKKKFPQITDKQISSSRSTDFEEHIMNATKGRGVDIVLNSLAEEKLIASVRCLAKGGRFIEIGKFDLANDNTLKLLLLERDASFHGKMLDGIFTQSPTRKTELHPIFLEGIKNGAIRPLGNTTFKMDQVEEAFRYMTTGKHMGKVLIEIRPEEKEKIIRPTRQLFPACPRYNCDTDKTYIICGGLGGFGLELADWLALRDCKKLVLVSRHGITTGYQAYRIAMWKSYGCIIKICTDDITTYQGCQNLINAAKELGPIQAIFNLAVVLKDAILENQTEEAFQISFEPKAYATQYLDQVTRASCPELRDFVIFSSVSCGRGNAGQTNYGMANSVMERICEKRRADGLPAIAIEWGAVGDVGLIAELQDEAVELEIGGTLQQRISNCLEVMDVLLRQTESAIVSSMVVAEKRAGSGGADNIVDAIANILGVKDLKMISLQSTLAEVGMDSMTAVEIKQTLEREFEVFLTAQDIKTMTFARLIEIQAEKDADNQTDSKKERALFGLSMIIRLIGDPVTTNSPVVSKKCQTSDKLNVPTCVLFSGLEGIALIMEPLYKLLEADLVMLQFPYETQKDSIEEMAGDCVSILEEKILKSQPFTIIGYSFGGIIALEAVKMLEEKGYCGTLICIDSAPDYLKALTKLSEIEVDDKFQVNIIVQLMSLQIPYEVIAQHLDSLFKCSTFDDRIKLAQDIVGKDSPYGPEYTRACAISIYKRLKALVNWNPTFKLKSKVMLFKPTLVSIKLSDEDYGLSKVCQNPVEVQVFEGNHVTILENPETSLRVNEILQGLVTAQEDVASKDVYISVDKIETEVPTK